MKMPLAGPDEVKRIAVGRRQFRTTEEVRAYGEAMRREHEEQQRVIDAVHHASWDLAHEGGLAVKETERSRQIREWQDRFSALMYEARALGIDPMAVISRGQQREWDRAQRPYVDREN